VNQSKIPVLKSHPQYEIAKQMKLGGSIVAEIKEELKQEETFG
jgi:hypothetical protein